MGKITSKDRHDFRMDIRLKSRSYHLELDWPRFREQQITFTRSNNGNNGHEDVTRSIMEWDTFFFEEEPIKEISEKGQPFGCTTSAASYLISGSGAVNDIYCEMLRGLFISKERKLPGGSLEWYYVGDDFVLDGGCSFGSFF